jgi:HAMP domain-containing protein
VSSPWTNVASPEKRQAGPGRRARGGLARTLLFFLLPLILGPLITFAVLIYREVQTDLTRNINNQLTTLATLKEAQLHQWASARVTEVNAFARQKDIVDSVRTLTVGGGAAGSYATSRLNEFLLASPFYEAMMLADAKTGEIMVSTVQLQYSRFIGQKLLTDDEVARAALGAYLLPPIADARLDDIRMIVAAPVTAPDQGVVALVLAFVRDEQLLDIVAASPGLSTAGRSFVVTSDGYELVSFTMRDEPVAESAGIRAARVNHQNGHGIYVNEQGDEVYGVYHWLPAYELALLVEEGTAEAFAPLRRFTQILLLIAVGSIAVSTAGVLFFSRRLLTRPLGLLMDGAQRLAAGDLSATVKLRRRDEIGMLAEAFNSMAAELRSLYQDLEKKVEARTHQLETAAEVGRAATSILDPDELLVRGAELIRDRFGYYHVSVFLLDETARWAVLRESTGEIGAELKARGHRLAVGSNSLIGWVTANHKSRIALDVGGDEVYLQNKLLPDTRSEAALPLRIGDRLIGALDVQSRSLNAFNQADIQVLQVLADQIAVALENGRLFRRQERVAELEQAVGALTSQIHKALNLDGILESAATALGQAFGAQKVVVRLAPEARPALGSVPAGPNAGNGHGALPGEGSNGHAPDDGALAA